MKKIINGKKYDTDTAECVYDGDRTNGRKLEIYRKKNGEFFSFHQSQWAHESDDFEALSLQRAKDDLAMLLSGEEYEAIFGEVEE